MRSFYANTLDHGSWKRIICIQNPAFLQSVQAFLSSRPYPACLLLIKDEEESRIIGFLAKFLMHYRFVKPSQAGWKQTDLS